MPVNVTSVLSRAAKALSDVDEVRWTQASKLEYFNDGLLEIAVQKPTAFSTTVEIALNVGTLQIVPAAYSGLVRATRNVSGVLDATPRVGGRVITPARQDILNDQFLDWHNPSSVPFGRITSHVIADEMHPRQFYVFPGNDGTGIIEAIVSLIPTPITGAVNANTTAPIDQVYFNALADYVASRCYGEDMILNGSAQRAQVHYGLFQAALGVRVGIEGAQNVNTTNKETGQ
jgi:hypothetical protein